MRRSVEELIGRTDAYFVWHCYILGNEKTLYSVPEEGLYWEVTYDKENDRYYVDKYEKVSNQVIE